MIRKLKRPDASPKATKKQTGTSDPSSPIRHALLSQVRPDSLTADDPLKSLETIQVGHTSIASLKGRSIVYNVRKGRRRYKSTLLNARHHVAPAPNSSFVSPVSVRIARKEQRVLWRSCEKVPPKLRSVMDRALVAINLAALNAGRYVTATA